MQTQMKKPKHLQNQKIQTKETRCTACRAIRSDVQTMIVGGKTHRTETSHVIRSAAQRHRRRRWRHLSLATETGERRRDCDETAAKVPLRLSATGRSVTMNFVAVFHPNREFIARRFLRQPISWKPKVRQRKVKVRRCTELRGKPFHRASPLPENSVRRSTLSSPIQSASAEEWIRRCPR